MPLPVAAIEDMAAAASASGGLPHSPGSTALIQEGGGDGGADAEKVGASSAALLAEEEDGESVSVGPVVLGEEAALLERKLRVGLGSLVHRKFAAVLPDLTALMHSVVI